MKNIKPEELPEILTDEIIECLVEMAMEFPKTNFDWAKVSKVLEKRGQLMTILDIVEEREKKIEEDKNSQMTDEEKKEREESRQRMLKKLEEDPYHFFGNMSRPDTPEEYKSRYGVWPDGTDGETYEPKK